MCCFIIQCSTFIFKLAEESSDLYHRNNCIVWTFFNIFSIACDDFLQFATWSLSRVQHRHMNHKQSGDQRVSVISFRTAKKAWWMMTLQPARGRVGYSFRMPTQNKLAGIRCGCATAMELKRIRRIYSLYKCLFLLRISFIFIYQKSSGLIR